MKKSQTRQGLRPSFEIETRSARKELVSRARDILRRGDCPLDGEALDDHMRVTLPAPERKAWTPVLDVRLEEEAGGLRLRCQYGPAPGAWTAFMAVYIGAVFMAFTGLMFGSSQMTVGQQPWAFWFVPLAVVIVLLLHLAARRGQAATQDQMDKLRSCLTHLVEEAESPAPSEQGENQNPA
jgi:hypothetical protein